MDRKDYILKVEIFADGTANGFGDAQAQSISGRVNQLLSTLDPNDVQNISTVCSSDSGYRMAIVTVTYYVRKRG